MSYKIGMVSLGCAKNLTDAETMLGILSNTENRYEIVSEPQDSDIIIVNTCGFIDKAKQESVDTILEMAEYKETGKCKFLIVTGCLTERYKEELLEELPEVDAILGTGDYSKIAETIQSCFDGSPVHMYGNQNDTISTELPRIISTGKSTAYLKIAEGCDNFCTYCIIPKLRGKYRSRPVEDIIKEANQLVDSGVCELILIAQNTTRYGVDLYGGHTLAKLLDKLSEIKDLVWIRVHYCYPEEITDELIDVFSKNPKVCKYMDIPVQHINDSILKRMGRKSTSEEIRSLLSKLRAKVEDITIRTSLIVGFPGETEKQFEELMEFIKWAEFDRMGVFTYSQEEDTPAALFTDQTEEEIKEKRYDMAMSIQKNISVEKIKKCIGKETLVLVEGYDFEQYMYYGRSYKDSIEVDGKVYFASENEVEVGSFCKVKILDVDEYDLVGVMIVEHCE